MRDGALPVRNLRMPAGAGASAPASALPLQTVQQHTFNVARTARAHVRLPRRALIGFASHRLPPPQPYSSWNSSTQAVVASTSFVPTALRTLFGSIVQRFLASSLWKLPSEIYAFALHPMLLQ